MQSSPRKILITGPESTGKSTLCAELSLYYKASWIKEYAREYLAENGVEYRESDLLKIAQEQFLRQNQALTKASSYLFCDTGLEVMKVWAEYKYHRCDPWITGNMAEQNFSAVFLCDIDIPWEDDPLREYPDPQQRHDFLELYKQELTEIYGGYSLISGTVQERVQKVVTLLDTIQ